MEEIVDDVSIFLMTKIGQINSASLKVLLLPR